MTSERCSFCIEPVGAKDLKIKPCAAGNTGLQVAYMRGSMIYFLKKTALGYTDIKYCPMCGREIRRN